MLSWRVTDWQLKPKHAKQKDSLIAYEEPLIFQSWRAGKAADQTWTLIGKLAEHQKRPKAMLHAEHKTLAEYNDFYTQNKSLWVDILMSATSRFPPSDLFFPAGRVLPGGTRHFRCILERCLTSRTKSAI